MNHFITSILNSLQSENWHAALGMALTAPDICGWLENPTVGSQRRYEDWFDKYLLHEYKNFMSGSDCYALRCAYLHEGTDDIQRQRARDAITRFAFATLGSHRCKFDSVLLLDVQMFCDEMCVGIQSWITDTNTDPDIQSRISELLIVKTKEFQPVPWVCIQ